MTLEVGSRPGIRPGVRLEFDRVRRRPVLLFPEGVLALNDTAAAVVELCDTRRTVEEIVARLGERYSGVTSASVLRALADLESRGLVGAGREARAARPVRTAQLVAAAPPRSPAPLGLLAELTYRCPLQCTYCANPLNLGDYRDELDTAGWQDVFAQARDLGVLQLHLSGGEPGLRKDLVELVATGHELGFYLNLVTSGVSLSAARIGQLADAGLDHFQLSLQDAEAAPANAIAGRRAHERKLAVAEAVRHAGLPLTINVVLHKGNVARIPAIAALAADLGADRLELAHTQFYGWALRNRGALLPSRAQVERAAADVAEVRARFGTELEIVHVAADYYSPRPKPCNYGWGSRQLVVTPVGGVLPCLAAETLPELEVPSVRTDSLASIWYDSPAFRRFRGTDWLPEPCQGCVFKEVDFGGCRCQAYQVTGDAAATDPVCHLSEHHQAVLDQVENPGPALAVPRRMP
ncbi:pyrroloquinoline quinone biosynthesis protein PqqE [Amycolatopsis rhabdoformis]|uniref:PqqA peptide cyclase n=1 Tax=Amycolatopsis rhabdoformis TaxID=1448059 RepID=A0ABZ1IF22_9PSEU|nr:pyrroloquinoline quinone biosynthesis protein PqqE [Amycolatopsis rhabdoformis]WSE32149.1 pyrroloquinoline quinone biosynthesis protein PqqE [Amycolatopsis rhabdoformis]